MAANVNQPKGNIDGPRQNYTLATNDQLDKARGLPAADDRLQERRADPAARRRQRDRRRRERAARRLGERQARLILNVQRQPGANIIQVAERVKALLPQLAPSLPQGMDVTILSDRTETVRASVKDVQFTLVLTVFLVVP